MIVICEECGKKYRIDPNKIKGKEASFKCKACSHIITAYKPAPSSEGPKPAAPPPKAPSAETPPVVERPAPATAEISKKPAKKKAAKAPKLPKMRMSLVTKALPVFVIVALAPLAIYWYISSQTTASLIQNDTEKFGSQVATGLVSHMDEWFDKNLRALIAASKQPGIISMNRLEQEPVLKSIQKAYPWKYLVFTVGVDGMNVARSDGKPLKDYSDRQYYKDIIGGKKYTWQTLIGKTSKKPALVQAVPIKQGKKVVGVIANAMHLTDISKRVANWREGSTGRAFLLDEKGKVLAHSNAAYVRSQKKLNKHPLIAAYKKGERGMITFTDISGDKTLGLVRKTRNGWLLAIQQSVNEAFEAFQIEQEFAYTILGATAVLALLIAWFSVRAMAKPIRDLTDAADRISVGELDVEIKTNRKDEIGDLAQAIARMQDSIRLSIDRLRRRRR